MPKANRAAVLQRTQEVVRLLLAGAEFEDIWQFATQQGWNLSRRQIHRYIELNDRSQ